MSSKIKWGGIAGIVAAALFVVSAIVEPLSPLRRIYDSAASYLYLGVVVAAYIAVIISVLGIHALHSGRPRYGRLGTTGTVLTIAGYLIMIVVRMISMAGGSGVTWQRPPWRRTGGAHWFCAARRDHS